MMPGISGAPVMENDLPDPVWPYAKRAELKPCQQFRQERDFARAVVVLEPRPHVILDTLIARSIAVGPVMLRELVEDDSK